MLTRTKRSSRARLHVEVPVPVSIFRDLYTRVLLSTGVENHTVLGVTSAIDGEGKTTIASNLAARLADDGALAARGGRAGDILFVDCNQGLSAPPMISEHFDVPATPGLIPYLQQQCRLEDVVKETRLPGLSILPLGGTAHHFSILIRSIAMHELMQRFRERFALIIVDLPSILTTSDTQVLTGLTDYLLLVVRSGVTPTKLVRQALDELEQEKLVGLVLNDWRPDLPLWLEHRL